jgi:hypothetical protein
MNLQENIKRILREDRKLSNFLRRRLENLDYEVERYKVWGGHNICIFFKSDIEYFETIMENAIDFMYYNYFSNIDDNSGEWAHIYLDMVNYIRKNYQYKIMKHYDDNCGSGLIPLKESIRKVLREESEDKKLKLVKSIIYNMFDNIINLEYNTERNEITVYYDKQEELDGSEICDTINNFTGLNVVLWYDYKKRMELKKEPDFYLDTERYEEEIYENYNPAGKEITPKEIKLIHERNVINESEDKLNILLNRHFDEVFDNLTLVIDNGGYCRWFFNDEDIPEDDHDDDSVFSKNLAGTLWVQNCDEFRKLVDVRTYLSLSAHEIKIKLMRYINNRYREQFLQGFFGTDGFVKIVDSHHCVDLYGLLP